jgi:NRPS condensation-like uncharacterized protein
VRVIVFEGRLDERMFERALHHLLERRPLLTSAIVRTPDEPPRFVACHQWPEFRVVDRIDAEQWRSEFEHQLATAVGVGEDPPMRVCVVCGEDRGEVVLSCHHAVCDGRSLTGFCRDLVHEYEALQRGQPGDPDAVHGEISPAIEDLVPSAFAGPRRQRILDDYLAWATGLMQAPPGFLVPRREAGIPGVRARRLLTYAVPPEQVQRLAASAHAQGTSIGGALAAATLRSALDLAGPGAPEVVGLSTTIDVRPYLRADVPMANMGVYATGSVTPFEDVRSKPYWALAREVSDSIAAGFDALTPFCTLLTMKTVTAMIIDGFVPMFWPQFLLANLGRLDLPRHEGSFRVRSIHGGTPVAGLGPAFFCSAVGLAGALHVDVNYQFPDVADEMAADFGHCLLERLTVESGAAATSSP